VAVREIVTIGHPVLRQRAAEVAPEDVAGPEVQGLIDDLLDTMRAAHGAGLAAPQIAVPRRVAVIEVDHNPRYPYKPPIPLRVLVNPVVTLLDGDRFVNNEGCLSVPDLRGDVARATSVEVRSLDRDGRPQVEVWRGLSAGTFQHELDHLDGTLFVDRVDDRRTLSTWAQFERWRRAEFVARVDALVERFGS
jgi:peptide deformylase